MCSGIDGLQIDKTTFHQHLRDLQYNYDYALAKKMKASEALENLRVSVEDVLRHVELFYNKVPIYYGQFKTDLHKVFASFLVKFQDSTKESLKKGYLVIKKKNDVNFVVVDAMFRALETELSHLRPSLNRFD